MTTTGFWATSTSSNAFVDPTGQLSNVGNSASSTESGRVLLSSYDGHLASFIFLVAGLEKTLRGTSPIVFSPGTSFLDTRIALGSGHTSIVERAEWKNKSDLGLETSRGSKWGKFVALKYVRRKDYTVGANWREILLEIRALLHEPIRYHPNIVRLLGLTWAAIGGTRSVFPVLALEYAEFGTLDNLQMNSDTLPFRVKKKLCHDISKGLSILHASGIVHGDLKHKNVLVFRNKDQASDIIYTAKLADFGGSVMDLVTGDQRSLHMGTRPYNAPEARGRLEAEELKLTDIYSLGLCIWQTMLDGKNPFTTPEFINLAPDEIDDLKSFDLLLNMIKKSVRAHLTTYEREDMELLDLIFENTIQGVANKRSLVRTIAALQVVRVSEIDLVLSAAQKANEVEQAASVSVAPGTHGITVDSLGTYIAKTTYGDYDFQQKGPGYRPKLSSPDPAEFVFEPWRLKTILDWSLQQDIVRDLEYACIASPGLSTTQIPCVRASFALFQCYLHEFGVKFDAEKACYWLRVTAESEDGCVENYLAQAWCWRFHYALGVTLDADMGILRNWIHTSIMRGHRRCIDDSLSITKLITDSDEKKLWIEALQSHTAFLNNVTGGIGMPYFIPRKLRRAYTLENLNALDQQIQAEFSLRGVDTLDKVFVNHRGDGLLHMAAAMGNLIALKHLIEVYNPNIDIPNRAEGDTPLLSACRGGHLDCALFLLERGASANGATFTDDTPLQWLCAFTDADMPIIAQKLLACGASLKSVRNYRLTRHAVWADPEYLFILPTSPLSRAVMMNSLPAVKVLLASEADPLDGLSASEFPSTCPIVLAAVLTLPRILEVMLACVDTGGMEISRIFTDMEMLLISTNKVATVVDPTSLESRLSRIGPNYKAVMYETLELLQSRDRRNRRWETEGNDHRALAEKTMLAKMVSLGSVDVVDSLLRLGHSIHGQPNACPIVECVRLNHEALFRLLVGHGANIFTKVSTSNGAQHSLLQVSADRPSQSRPGIFIPRYLLRMGIPADPLRDGSRSAFASAVKNQDFELADLLLRHGADIDFAYTPLDSMHWITIFGELVQSPTEKNIESIRYLLGLHTTTALPNEHRAAHRMLQEHGVQRQGNRLPSFIVDTENQLSVLHLAATHDLRSDSEALILGRIVTDILTENKFSVEEAINNCHPSVGTALWAATLCCNLEVVSALLEKGANPNLAFNGITPLKIALEVDHQKSSAILDKAGKLERRKRYETIADILRSAGAVTLIDI
ncbi:hypothetical protein BDZ94DRAFT_1168109 [Collybia nuda]|uniref:Protein kinase domain-containing protein n=1 Tax=Collybia nuda TaxID=64659 RepID=A0A9P5Y2R8_9AGAR|nr:hypothetical protein BDZ94DRAFT_1168109 [Collybia nuda]